MVKNTKGGKGGKKGARKHITTNNFNQKLCLAEEEGEIYACVYKLLGNGMCHVNCLDKNNTLKHRLCIIRNKFRGRGKRGNEVAVGTYVLIGVREWESSKEGSMEKCDLIEVYSKSEFERVKNSVNNKWNIIHVNCISESTNDDEYDDIFMFSNENTELKEQLEEEVDVSTENVFGDGDEIDIDDI